MRLLPIGLKLAVQLLKFFDPTAELFAAAGEPFLGLRFLFRARFQALVPCEELQRQGLELIEHVAEEFGELVLSCPKFVQRNVPQARRPDALADRPTWLNG